MSLRVMTMQQEALPWSWPLPLGGAILQLRTRSMITAVDHEGCLHRAELSPCPGVHPETLSEACELFSRAAQPLLQRNALDMQRWCWTRPYFGLLDAAPVVLTSVQTAVEQLLLSWAQQQDPSAFALPAPQRVQGSALLVLGRDAEASWNEFKTLWDQNFRVFKCKVGRQAAPLEYEFLQRIAEHAQGALLLRLDANQKMNPTDLQFWREHSQDLPIEYWEEPSLLHGSDFRPQARDESLWSCDARSAPAADFWILKIHRLGLSAAVRLLQSADDRGIACVLSNAFESGLSLRVAAWIYARFCARPRALGFGTARFLSADSWQTQAWSAPELTIPRWPFAVQGG